MRLLRLSVASLALATGLATPAFADPALWKVSDADSDIYLFGSVHAFTREVDWRTPQFDEILEAADYVFFEVVMDVEAYSTITQITLTKGMFGNGGTLADVLTPGEHERLAAAAASVGADMAMLDRMQPWLATMTLANAATPPTTAGVEILVDAEVALARKRSLETAGEQMSFLADMTMKDQVDTLVSMVEGIESGAIAQLEPMLEAWEDGDTDRLATVFESQVTERDGVLYDRLLTERNSRWLTRLEQLLADDDESLVIVGAAHLIGIAGVPALLEAKGYTVERIDRTQTDGPSATGTGADSRR